MDEDALKKNTDCVYFLASPLTCKKGNDCEFRHSESARVNPRDCRYWLGGNCLSWDCPFRHPPLEGRPTIAAAAAPVRGGLDRSRTPCYYFSQGFCAKGEKCTFMHGAASLQPPKSASTERPIKAAPASNLEPNDKGSSAPATNGLVPKPSLEVTLESHLRTDSRPTHVGVVEVSPRKEVRAYPGPGVAQNGASRIGRPDVASGNSGLGSSRLRVRQDDRAQNGMEPDEWWEESSPGFDVLVDDGPEQSRYPDDPEFQLVSEAGMETGKGGSGNHARVRSMRMADDMEQYEYDFPHPYDHGNYEGGAPYEHGVYDYNAHDQQLGYEPSNAYDRISHQRAAAYSDRGGADEMLARERLGLSMDVDGRSGGGNNDPRARIPKRRRPDGGHLHVSESHSRRQRTEMPLDEYQQHQRHQEDQQKQHELQLRHQLFMQHDMRSHSSSNSRRMHEKNALESGVVRRALQDAGAEMSVPSLERAQNKSLLKVRPLNERPRSGSKDVEHSRMSKVLDSSGESESRNYMDLEGNRKTEKEVRKEPSTFAGPKTLAQIKAEKRKGQVEEIPKVRESSNGPKVSVQSGGQVKGPAVRSSMPVTAAAAPDVASTGAFSAEDRKVRVEKVVSLEAKKPPNFEGPKSLSAILEQKRKLESNTDSKPGVASRDHLQRLLPSATTVIASGVEAVSSVDFRTPGVVAEVEADLDAEVEDGELLSDDEAALKARHEVNDQERHNHSIDSEREEVRAIPSRDEQWQQDEAENALQTVEGGEDEDMPEAPVHGTAVDKPEDILDYGEVQEFDDGREEIVDAEDEEGYGLDDEEEDDFAKKLGGFFT